MLREHSGDVLEIAKGLGDVTLDALPAELRRSKQGFEPAADDLQRAVRHQRRAREQSRDQVIAEPVGLAWRVSGRRGAASGTGITV